MKDNGPPERDTTAQMAQTSAMPDLRQPEHQLRPDRLGRQPENIRHTTDMGMLLPTHHYGILILTRHDDLKEAIRAWNAEATRQERKHSK